MTMNFAKAVSVIGVTSSEGFLVTSALKKPNALNV